MYRNITVYAVLLRIANAFSGTPNNFAHVMFSLRYSNPPNTDALPLMTLFARIVISPVVPVAAYTLYPVSSDAAFSKSCR